MREIKSDEVPAFVRAKRAAALHFDAEWDTNLREMTRKSMLDAESALAEQANFAEIDCDANVELARSIPVLNVPLVAYYRDGELVAALVGAGQNVRARLERVLRGEKIGYNDGTSATRDSTEERKLMRKRESISQRMIIAFISATFAILMSLTVWQDSQVLRGEEPRIFSLGVHLIRAVSFGFVAVVLAGLSIACCGDALFSLIRHHLLGKRHLM